MKWHGPSVSHEHALDFVDNDGGGRGKGAGRSGDSGEDGNDGDDGGGGSCVGGSVDGCFGVLRPLLTEFFAPFSGEGFGGSRLPLLVIIPLLLSAIEDDYVWSRVEMRCCWGEIARNCWRENFFYVGLVLRGGPFLIL